MVTKLLRQTDGRAARKARLVSILHDTADSIMDREPAPLLAADDELLDSYSRTVSGVVERVRPTVVNIRV
jgi:hypothetical protein